MFHVMTLPLSHKIDFLAFEKKKNVAPCFKAKALMVSLRLCAEHKLQFRTESAPVTDPISEPDTGLPGHRLLPWNLDQSHPEVKQEHRNRCSSVRRNGTGCYYIHTELIPESSQYCNPTLSFRPPVDVQGIVTGNESWQMQ